ncbi:hypothetical protein AMTRI_Chr13g117950 [Amborella trichopoda]
MLEFEKFIYHPPILSLQTFDSYPYLTDLTLARHLATMPLLLINVLSLLTCVSIAMGAILIVTIAAVKTSKGTLRMSKGVKGQNVEEYSYKDIKKMTNNLREKLGQGGFESVYKGKLIDGRLIAVKVLVEPKGSDAEFTNEVATIGCIHHINVSWAKYLHRGCENRTLHLDIKPHNILLDEDFCPKIFYFGLAKLYSNNLSVIALTGVPRMIGYMAPEVYSRLFGVVSHKSDAYSFGMLLLEMVGGRKNFDQQATNSSEAYFPDWVYSHLECGGDLELGDIKRKEKKMEKRMIVVVEMLDGNSQTLVLPPKPSFSSPKRRSSLESLFEDSRHTELPTLS